MHQEDGLLLGDNKSNRVHVYIMHTHTKSNMNLASYSYALKQNNKGVSITH